MTQSIIIEPYVEKAIEEINKPSLEETREYLQIYSIVRESNLPTVSRVETEEDENSVVVYFPLEKERFYLAVHFDKSEMTKVRGTRIEAGNSVKFRVTSFTLSFEELALKTTLSPLTGWSKGQQIGTNVENKYAFSALHFNPFPHEAYDMEYKMRLLLNKLEKDRAGVRYFAETCEAAYISINSHRISYPFGGVHLDKELIRRLSKFRTCG